MRYDEIWWDMMRYDEIWWDMMRYVLVPSWTELRWRLGPWSPIKRLGFNLHAVQRHGNTHRSVKKTLKCIDKFDIINVIMSYFSRLFDSLVILLKRYCYCKKAIQCSLCLIPVLGLHTCVFAAQTDIDKSTPRLTVHTNSGLTGRRDLCWVRQLQLSGYTVPRRSVFQRELT